MFRERIELSMTDLNDQEREALQAAAQVYEASKHPGSYTRVTPQTRRDTQAVIDAYHAALAVREEPSELCVCGHPNHYQGGRRTEGCTHDTYCACNQYRPTAAREGP